MTDIQQAITRLRAADKQHPDFWSTLQDRDADPQMLRDVVAVARAYCRVGSEEMIGRLSARNQH